MLAIIPIPAFADNHTGEVGIRAAAERRAGRAVSSRVAVFAELRAWKQRVLEFRSAP